MAARARTQQHPGCMQAAAEKSPGDGNRRVGCQGQVPRGVHGHGSQAASFSPSFKVGGAAIGAVGPNSKRQVGAWEWLPPGRWAQIPAVFSRCYRIRGHSAAFAELTLPRSHPDHKDCPGSPAEVGHHLDSRAKPHVACQSGAWGPGYTASPQQCRSWQDTGHDVATIHHDGTAMMSLRRPVQPAAKWCGA